MRHLDFIRSSKRDHNHAELSLLVHLKHPLSIPQLYTQPSHTMSSAMIDEVAALLPTVSVFKRLSKPQVLELAALFDPIKIQDGEVLIVKGRKNDMFIIIADGELELYTHGTREGVLKAKDYFGLQDLFIDRSAPINVVAKRQTTFYALRKESFQKFLQSKPDLAIPLLSSVVQSIEDSKVSAYFDGSTKESPLSKVVVRMFDTKPYQQKFFVEQNSKLGLNYQIEFLKEKLTSDTAHLASGASVVCVFVHDSVDKDVAKILKEQNVQLVAYRCAGFDTCDVPTCDNMGLSVVRVPGYSPNAIAEHAVAMMLALNRKLMLANSRVRTGDFSLDGLVGFDMKGKTVGVIGTGKIGFCLVQILLGFGCRVLCYDIYKNAELLKNPAIAYVDLDQIFSESHIISLHAPLTPETQHMINEKNLAKMREGVMLINTSRGGLVDTKVLIEALKNGKVGSCGLDVVEGENDYFYEDVSEEPMRNDLIGRLMSFNNVLITAHQAYLTREALTEIAVITLKNIEEFQQGKRLKQLRNSVNQVYPAGDQTKGN